MGISPVCHPDESILHREKNDIASATRQMVNKARNTPRRRYSEYTRFVTVPVIASERRTSFEISDIRRTGRTLSRRRARFLDEVGNNAVYVTLYTVVPAVVEAVLVGRSELRNASSSCKPVARFATNECVRNYV